MTPDPTDVIDSSLGAVTWHSSDVGTGPDVGISIGMGAGKVLYVGEISRDLHAAGGKDVVALGADDGWWLVMWPDAEILARFVDQQQARTFMERLETALVP
jgi:hypothetical protein